MEATCKVPSSYGQGVAPASLLHVLLMHGDDIIISLLDKKLYICLHKVAVMVDDSVQNVLRILKDKASLSDMVICEVADMTDKVVQNLIMQIESQVSIPVNLVRPNGYFAKVLNRTSDAWWYTLKGPMQYIVEKKMAEAGQMEHLRTNNAGNGGDHVAIAGRVNEITTSNEGLRRKNSNHDQVDKACSPRPTKQRVIWTSELHREFVDAVHKLGIEKVVPKKILELMNRPELTRENVASHLQKYRLHMKKQKNVAQVQQNEPSDRRCSSVSNPAIGSTMTPNPFMKGSSSEPVILQTSQSKFHAGDLSAFTCMEGTRLFDNMDGMAHLDAYAFDDNINLMSQGFGWDYDDNIDLMNQGFGCDSHAALGHYGTYEIDGGASGLHWSNNHNSFNYVSDGGVATGLIDEDVSKEMLIESNPSYDQMAYNVPQGHVSPENNVYVNIGHHQHDNNNNNNNNVARLQTYSNPHINMPDEDHTTPLLTPPATSESVYFK